jgi:O-antigen ligase
LNHLVKSEKLTGFFDAIWKAQAGGLILLTFLSFFPSWFHLEEYLFFALLLIALGTAWLDGKSIGVRTPIDLPLLLFVGWVLLTIPFATDPAYSFAEWRKVVAQVLVFYWVVLVLRAQDSKALTHGVLAAAVIGTAALCAYALTDFVAKGGTWRDRYVRASAPSSDFQWLSTYMVIAIPVLVSAWVIVRTMWQRLACGGTVVLALLAQATSYTRAGWLGLVAQGVTLGLCTARRRLVVWLAGSCLVIGVGLLSVSQMGYQRSTVDPWTLNARLVVWKAGIDEMLKHPFVGVGYGNYSFSTIVHGTPIGDMVMGLHNTFLMVGVSAGIPALATLVWILVAIARAAFEKFKTSKDRWERLVNLAIVLLVVGFSVRNLFDYMFAGSLAYLFWILVATGLSQDMRSNREFSH